MDTPARQRPDSSSNAIRKSPPGSLGGSPRGMIHPPNPSVGVPQPSRASGLAPSLPPPDTRSPGAYNSNSYSHSTSPSTASGGIPDNAASDQSASLISPMHMSTANLHTHKRAYRSRRKDPSCDACRERKVKCDATETTACSECSSRNHKCQFTKDTNRRMSSIKQVQDLQSQIAELQQQNTQLLTKMGDSDSMEIDPTLPRSQIERKSHFSAPRRKAPLPTMPNFGHVRSNIHAHSAGIFQTPRSHHNSKAAQPVFGAHDIPPRADFARISRSYLDAVHEAYPVLHWPTFQSEVERLYTTGNFNGMPGDWVGMYFAVLACGCLDTPNLHNGGMRFYEIASQAMTPWPQEATITHVRLLFLLSLYATENNMRSAGSMWLASAIRTAQTLALNRHDAAQLPLEAEMRRRVWWAIYVQDRITSLCTNLPVIINEDDCDDSLPSSADDRYMDAHNVPRPYGQQSTGYVAVIRIARLFAGVQHTLRSDTIPKDTLQRHEGQFRAIYLQLPEAYRPESDTRLRPLALSPVIALHLARFQLHRRNLSPACASSDRAAALANCAAVAHDTAKCIQRVLQNFDLGKDWARAIASSMVCIHVWRCTLILCLRGDYQDALMCVQASTAIGDSRKINTACGKNLLFFLEHLTERVRRGDGDPSHLAADEELLAYATGDLQSRLEHSWAWAGAPETPPPTSPPTASYPGVQAQTLGPNEATLPLRPSLNPPDATSARDWQGWGAVEYMVKMLMGRQKRTASGPAPGHSPTYYPPPHNPVKRVQLAPEGPPGAASKPATPSNASRISIANII